MLNFKKGLAIVLAAATALTFAPVANLGTAVSAYAATKANATFMNVPETVYIRDVKDTSVTLSPSWVVTSDSKSAKNGTDLYYQIDTADTTPNDQLTQNQFVNTATSGATTTHVKFDTSKKGSVTLQKDGNTAFVAGSVVIAAYSLNTGDSNFKLEGYKTISIQPYTNAAYDVQLDVDSVTLALGVTGETNKQIKIKSIFDQSGNNTNDTSSWHIASVYGTGIQLATAGATGIDSNTVATYDKAKYTFTARNAGSSKVTVIATKGTMVAVHQIDLEVLGTSQYEIRATVDGTKNSADIGFDSDKDETNGIDSPVVLDVKTNNTYDLASHMYKSDSNIVLSYESNNSKNTVDATTGLVKATTVTDWFKVTVTGKLNGKIVAKKSVYFKVNALPFNKLTVTGADKDEATVLTDVEYAYTNTKAPYYGMTEEKLAASQIKYVQIDVTENETSDPTESLNIVSTSGAIVTASLVGQHGSAFKGVSNAGVITVNKGSVTGVAVIKLVSNPTATTELTTSYIYVVVDKADPKIAAADSYKIGTDKAADTTDKWFESDVDFSAIQGTAVEARLLSTDYDDITAEQNLYTADDSSKFNNSIRPSSPAHTFDTGVKNVNYYKNTTVHIATAENKTEHVLIKYTAGAGTAYKVVTITSVPGVHNSVSKIEDATTGKTIYTSDMGTQIPEIVLDGNTTLKVTLAYSIDKNKTDVNISSTSLYTAVNNNPLNQNIMTATKEKVTKGDTFNTFYLYPTTQGTQVVKFTPSGDISDTDHSITYDDDASLAVTYRASKTPSKVTNVKVKNKKGAKVTVTFDAATNHNMKYWVQKKIGKKVSGKSVASNKTTLLVKKGATVKVRVKAYYYDNEGNKHVGKYSSWVTKKTDKK